MPQERRLSTTPIDLSRFDDPLYAEPRIGVPIGLWISSARASSLQAGDGVRLDFERDALPTFDSQEEAARAAAEIVAILERYGLHCSTS